MPGIIMILRVVNRTDYLKKKIIVREDIIAIARKDGNPVR
jgi:hypothetical protein